MSEPALDLLATLLAWPNVTVAIVGSVIYLLVTLWEPRRE